MPFIKTYKLKITKHQTLRTGTPEKFLGVEYKGMHPYLTLIEKEDTLVKNHRLGIHMFQDGEHVTWPGIKYTRFLGLLEDAQRRYYVFTDRKT